MKTVTIERMDARGEWVEFMPDVFPGEADDIVRKLMAGGSTRGVRVQDTDPTDGPMADAIRAAESAIQAEAEEEEAAEVEVDEACRIASAYAAGWGDVDGGGWAPGDEPDPSDPIPAGGPMDFVVRFISGGEDIPNVPRTLLWAEWSRRDANRLADRFNAMIPMRRSSAFEVRRVR